MNCEICNKHKAKLKDYRYIDGYFNGKTLVCEWCFDISDIGVIEIFNDKLNPKTFYCCADGFCDECKY